MKRPLILMLFITSFGLGFGYYLKFSVKPYCKPLDISKRKIMAVASRTSLKVQVEEVILRDFVGENNDSLFFSTENCDQLECISKGVTSHINLNIPKSLKDSIKSIYTINYYEGSFYLFAGNSPLALCAYQEKPPFHFSIPKNIFTRSAIISKNNLVFRRMNRSNSDQEFFAFNTGQPGKSILEHGISPMNKDAGLSTDGQLLYDSFSRKLIFVYFYKNYLLRIDSTLAEAGRINLHVPADTGNLVFKISNDGHSVRNQLPVNHVSRMASIYKGYCFIHSNVLSDGLDPDDFAAHPMVDCYQLKDGLYIGSFQLPDRYPIIRICMTSCGLICLSKHTVNIYKKITLDAILRYFRSVK